MTKNHRLISSYIIAHFVVDFACAFLIVGILYPSKDWPICLLIYNFCAFSLQLPIGLLADHWNRNALCAALGCGLVALSFGFGNIAVVAVVIAGIGNGLFHIGGGIDVLNISKEKPILLGIFVSPGALGIYLGTFLAKLGTIPVHFVIITLLITMATIMVASYIDKKSFRSENETISLKEVRSLGTLLAIVALFIVVILRSYIGMTSGFSWKGDGVWPTIYIIAVVLGKIGGGFLAVKLGSMRASIVSLGMAAILFLFSGNPWLGIAAVFFFNMTMPITLWAIARILFGCKGFSFGILTFGLFLGFVPGYLGIQPIFSTTTGFFAASLLSLALLLFGLRKAVE